MKLALVIFTYFPYGGLQRDMLAIAQEAVVRGHKVTVFCRQWQGEKPDRIKVVEVAAKNTFNIAGVKGFVDAFAKIYSAKDFDCLVGFNKMPGLDYYFCGDSCFAHKAYAERDWLYRLTPRARLYLSYERAVFGERSSTQIFSLVEAEQKLFAKYYATQPERFCSLPPGISKTHIACEQPEMAAERLREKLKLSLNTKIILCLGSGFHTKGVDISIASFAALQKMGQPSAVDGVENTSDSVLLVVGNDKADAYRQQAEMLGVANKVIFLGPLESVGELLHAVDLLLHPARKELAGNVLLEAMLCGCPVLATDICGFSHFITDAGMGDLVSLTAGPEKIASLMQSLLSIEKNRWRELADKLAKNKSLFRRAQVLINRIEDDFEGEPERNNFLQESKNGVGEKNASLIVDTGDTELILSGDFAKQWDISNAFSNAKNLTGQVTREVSDRQTLRFELNGCGYYRKWHAGVGWKEILKNILQLRAPVLGAKNEWNALNKLHALAIPSLTPVAYGRRGVNPAQQKSFIITRELENLVQVDHFFSQNKVAPQLKWKILIKVAQIARELHAAGINHRDFYLCHFVLHKDSLANNHPESLSDLAGPEIYLIDLHRAQMRAKVPERWLIKDLSGLLFSAMDLGFTQRDYWRFVRVYFNQEFSCRSIVSVNPMTKNLHDLVANHGELFNKIILRARKTYKRDFGIYPTLSKSWKF